MARRGFDPSMKGTTRDWEYFPTSELRCNTCPVDFTLPTLRANSSSRQLGHSKCFLCARRIDGDEHWLVNS